MIEAHRNLEVLLISLQMQMPQMVVFQQEFHFQLEVTAVIELND